MATPYRKFNTIVAENGVVYRKFNTISIVQSVQESESITLTENITVNVSQLKELYGESLSIIDSHLEIVSRKKYITSNAEITEKYNRRIFSNANIKAIGTQKNILSDAYITSKINQTILSDATIKSINNQKIITSDAYITANPFFRKTILSDANLVIGKIYNINNIVRFAKGVTSNILNKISFVKRVISDIGNTVSFVKRNLSDINNKVNTKKEPKYDINNDVRFLASWQKAGDFGFQSLGKTHIKVYINSAEATDVNVDTINIHKEINQAKTASFELARAYDASKPNDESVVEIKYSNYRLYKGYIVNISPTDNAEHIRIECQDEYWKQNRNNKYFFVGHKPNDNQEKYYNTIQEAISAEFSWSVPFGNFVPQVINCFAQGKSDTLTDLITQSGNYGWFYDNNDNKKLWKAGTGSIINLERQAIGTNLGLYQVIDHRFNENVSEIINKYRVQMGDKTIREFEGIKSYVSYSYSNFQVNLRPMWGSWYEKLAQFSSDGYGVNHPKPGYEKEYGDVFKKYYIPGLDSKLSSWSDRYPPRIRVEISAIHGFLNWFALPMSPAIEGLPQTGIFIDEGFTIDYENKIVTFNEAQYLYRRHPYTKEITDIRAPLLKLALWKKNYYTVTKDPSDNPEEDISNPLMFFTDKMGSYPETIIKDLDLNSLSVQEGMEYVDNDGITQIMSSWDDTDFAKDLANWELSKLCDKKITGDIKITIDAACLYNIDLSKRIFINGITESAMNIISIDYNVSTFTVTIKLENSRAYNRSISLQSRGD